MICREDSHEAFRDPGAAQAGGYVLAVAGVLVAVALVLHPLPAGGFDERPSILRSTPWWGPIHIAIAAGFVLCVLGSLLLLISGGRQPRSASGALWWGAMAVGMIFFTGVALINGWVMHPLAARGGPTTEALVYEAFNQLLIGYGWLGNPLFLAGLTGAAYLEAVQPRTRMPRAAAWLGLVAAVLSWGRGIGSATGLYFLEPLIYANVPAFLWLSYFGLQLAREASARQTQ